MARHARNPQNPDNLPRVGDGQGDENRQNDRVDQEAGVTVGGASRNPASQGLAEGPDADRRRRAEQKIHADNQQAAAEPTRARDALRKAAVDRLDKAIRLHEKHFEDFSGGLIFSSPAYTPPQLHDLRVDALRVYNNPASSAEQLMNAALNLESVEFHRSREDAHRSIEAREARTREAAELHKKMEDEKTASATAAGGGQNSGQGDGSRS